MAGLADGQCKGANSEGLTNTVEAVTKEGHASPVVCDAIATGGHASSVPFDAIAELADGQCKDVNSQGLASTVQAAANKGHASP
eukprot:8534579-Karenia_brevis.AAC.1